DEGPAGQGGPLLAGTIVPSAPELRDLHSNELFLEQAAAATGGRVLRDGFESPGALFDREGLRPSVSFRPLRDFLLAMLMAILLMDVAVRRIAWDWPAISRIRSEEHTSELQSRRDLVCRLLLEKKKKKEKEEK